MKTRIMYLRDKNRNPIGCLAIGLDSLKNPTKISYQLSVLNPVDSFNKKLGQLKALAKLEGQPFDINVNLDSDFSSHEIASIVMIHLKNNKSAPTRARKAAEHWLLQAGTKGSVPSKSTVNNNPPLFSLAALIANSK